MAILSQTVTITTDGSGAAEVYSGYVNGRIIALGYRPGDIETGATVTVTTETTVQAVLVKASAGTSNLWFYPRIAESKNTDGSALTSYDYICAANERVKIVVATGGDTLSGEMLVVTDDYPTIV